MQLIISKFLMFCFTSTFRTPTKSFMSFFAKWHNINHRNVTIFTIHSITSFHINKQTLQESNPYLSHNNENVLPLNQASVHSNIMPCIGGLSYEQNKTCPMRIVGFEPTRYKPGNFKFPMSSFPSYPHNFYIKLLFFLRIFAETLEITWLNKIVYVK